MFPVLLGAELGSAAYGLSLPDSRRAVRQVNLCPTSDLLGLVGTPRPRWSKPGVDTHELGPFLRGVLAGDPNAVELLWSEAYEICTEQGEWLLRHRTDLLDGRRLAAAYLSAARRQQQLGRTASSRRARFAAGKHCARLVEHGTALHQTGRLRLRVEREAVLGFAERFADELDTGSKLLDRFERTLSAPPALGPGDAELAEHWLVGVRTEQLLAS